MPLPALRRAVAALALLLPTGLVGQTRQALTPYQSLGRDLLRELVETNTTYSVGSTTKAAESLAARFRAAGFPAADVVVVGPTTGADAKDGNLVVRYRGARKRPPVVLIGHLDVVEARRADWVLDPFTLTEQDGHFYGRGTLDMKNGDASWVAALLRMKQERIVPAGDYILALTAGEEGGGGYNGIAWLLAHRPELLDGTYALNADGGGGELRGTTPLALDVDAAEKVFHSVRLTVRNPGGHSSLPSKDNAIYRLAAALGRLGAYDFPFQTNAITRAYFARTAALSQGPLAAEMRAVSAGGDTPDTAAAARLAARSPFYNAELRTTCVATLIEGGHAVNALPQRAQATVNCRILPGVDPAAVETTIRTVVADTAVVVTPNDTAHRIAPSPMPPALERTLRATVASVWGPLPVVPDMATGASDAVYLSARMPVYGVSGLFADPNNADDTRAHGLNERIGVRAFYDQLEFTYRLLTSL